MNRFDDIVSLLTPEVSAFVNRIDTVIKSTINEIRIRRNGPVAVVIKNTTFFVNDNGDICDYVSRRSVFVDDILFDKLFLTMCEYSIHTNMENLKNGYITLPYGARVGVASTAVIDSTGVVSVKNVTSLNIRIPNQCKDCSKGVLDCLYINTFPSVIVAGLPNSGKTTLIRDMARQLSSGFNNIYRKVAIVDERNEIAAKYNENLLLDIGDNTDVLTSFPKPKAIEIATRVLSPELIVCDEIATGQEIKAIKFGFSTGVRFVVSVHIGCKEDLINRDIIRSLLFTGEFDYIVLLDEYTYKPEIIEASEIINEIIRRDRVITDRLGVG
ncbi:MAG: hypothetical protein ACI4IN_04200 [Eubacterium sp.]